MLTRSQDGHDGMNREISFNVHGIVYVSPDDPEHQDPLERHVRELVELVEQVKDEQEYLVIRERVHRNTSESTNSRVKWWSIGQTILLVAVCLFQVFYLSKSPTLLSLQHARTMVVTRRSTFRSCASPRGLASRRLSSIFQDSITNTGDRALLRGQGQSIAYRPLVSTFTNRRPEVVGVASDDRCAMSFHNCKDALC